MFIFFSFLIFFPGIARMSLRFQFRNILKFQETPQQFHSININLEIAISFFFGILAKHNCHVIDIQVAMNICLITGNQECYRSEEFFFALSRKPLESMLTEQLLFFQALRCPSSPFNERLNCIQRINLPACQPGNMFINTTLKSTCSDLVLIRTNVLLLCI